MRAIVDLVRELAGLRELRRFRVLRHRDQDMRDVVFVGGRGGLLLVLEVLIEFARRDDDALDDVALPQDLTRNLALELAAVLGVVDAVGGQLLGQLLQSDVLSLGDVPHCGVDLLIGNLDAGAIGVLLLDLFQNQAVQYLLAQHAFGRQCDLLSAQTRLDLARLHVEFALQHDALVDHGHDPIEQRALV